MGAGSQPGLVVGMLESTDSDVGQKVVEILINCRPAITERSG
jgi:hypothetical protein